MERFKERFDYDISSPQQSNPSDSPYFIPLNLKKHLPHPKTPWLISEGAFHRLTPNSKFKQTEILKSDPEFNFIMNYFCENKPDGYSISKITCIHNKLTTAAFEVELQTMEEEAGTFPPGWRNEPYQTEREAVIQNLREAAIQSWKASADSFTPLEVPSTKKYITLSYAKVLPLWHGTSQNKATSICSSGFTFFGKHHFFHPQAKKGDFGSTDMGYFGSGIYFSSSAKYSHLYSQGHLLLSWVSMREPYPVISDIPHSTPINKCTDMTILEGKGAYQTYNSHYIPVASINPTNPNCMVYYPCSQDQVPDAEEYVVFQKSQTLPRFLIETSVDTPSFLSPKTTHVPYSSTTLHTSVRAGDFKTVQHWVQEDPNRLMDRTDAGETLWHTAIRGNQLQILQYLHSQDPQTLTKNENGFTFLHLACTFGHLLIIKWIYQNAPELLKVSHNNLTPAHVAAINEHLHVLDLFFDHLPPDLLTYLAKSPHPKALAHLLDKGLTPPVITDNQTLLHLAAQSAQEENILVLLKHKFDLESQDLQGRTPIFLATLQGHRSIVKLLLEHGAHVDIYSNERETLLHVAAHYGYSRLLQDLLKHPDGSKLVSATDVDGKVPLHRAVWNPPKPNIVQLLLKCGSNPNTLNNYGYSPLHWAAKHGHVESAEILLKHNAHLDIHNVNHDTPLDLALKNHQDDMFHVLLGTKQRLNTEKEKPTGNFEEFYFNRLRKARKENFIHDQVLYLIKLSEHYIELCDNKHNNPTTQQNNLLKSAKFLNAAIAVLEKSKRQSTILKDSLFKLMEKDETTFLKFHKLEVENYSSLIKTYRAQLQTARNNCEKVFRQQDPQTQNISATLTQALKQILIDLISTSQTLLGPPPVKWVAITMGSMARGEMCPYSGIQFAFLVYKATPEALTYFQKLLKLLQVRIINMGETAFPVFGEYEDSPTPDGFCMDTREKTPLTVEGCYEYEKFANFQSQKCMIDNIILTNTLNCISYLIGETKIFQKLRKITQKPLVSLTFSPRSSSKFHQALGIHLLNCHLTELEPNLSTEKKQIKVFDIKKELHRPLQEMLKSLTLFYNIQSQNSFEKVIELARRGIISRKGGENLKTVLSQVLYLRIQAHLFYRTEQEFLYPFEQHKTQDDNKLYLDDTLLEKIQAIYSVILPFHKCAKEFVTTKEKNAYRNCDFFDNSPLALGQYYEKTFQYKKAQEAYQQAVTHNTNDTSALFRLGLIEIELGDSKTSLKHAQQALELSLQKHGENHPDVALAHNNIGSALKSINIQGALDAHQKALKIFLAIYEENHPLVAISYNNNGIIFNVMGDHEQALNHHQKALKIRLALYGEIHPNVALSYHNMAECCLMNGNNQDSFNYAQKALNIKIAIYGVNHPELISSYDTLGRICCNLEQVDDTFQYYSKSLKIQIIVFGKNHPEVAKTFNTIGLALGNLGKAEEAIGYFQEALNIDLKLYGEYHTDVALCYDNIGWALNKIGKAKDALENHYKALHIWLSFQQTTSDNDPTVALMINNIGLAHRTLGNVQEYLADLKIQINLYRENHPSVSIGLSNLAISLMDNTEGTRGIEVVLN